VRDDGFVAFDDDGFGVVAKGRRWAPLETVAFDEALEAGEGGEVDHFGVAGGAVGEMRILSDDDGFVMGGGAGGWAGGGGMGWEWHVSRERMSHSAIFETPG